MRGWHKLIACAVVAVLCIAAPVFAQAPADAPKVWTGTASAGLALTSGNSDTSTVSAAYDIVYDRQRRNVVKSDGLFLRGKTEGELSANRIGLNIRDEYSLTPRVYIFGQNQYLNDEFKDIDFLLAPTFGAGYKLFDTMATQMTVDASVGGVWEKNPGFDVISSGAVAMSEKLTQTVTASTTFTQTFAGLWKTNDFGDSLFTLGMSLAASMSTRTQLKVEILDTFKNKPPLPTIQQNDIAVLMAIVYKI